MCFKETRGAAEAPRSSLRAACPCGTKPQVRFVEKSDQSGGVRQLSLSSFISMVNKDTWGARK